MTARTAPLLQALREPMLDGDGETRMFSGAAILIFTILLGLIGFGVWAAIAEIDELVRARGQVIAAARTQILQAPDNGIVAELLVREGDSVRKGQVLVRLDQSRVQAAYDDSRNKVAALRATLARLRAEVYGGTLTFPPDLAQWPAFIENQRQLYARRRQALVEGLDALAKSRRSVIEELTISEDLLRTGDIGQVDVIRLRRARSDIDGQIVNLRNKYFQDAQAEMAKAEEELATQEELLRERTTTLGYTELRASSDGKVRKINFNTLGAAVRQGDVLIEMLPTSSELIVEAKYSPADVAELKLGLPATVKLDAYDSSIYGALTGHIIYISPDALSEPAPQGGEQIYYRVHVRIDGSDVQDRELPARAGMTATVEVRTRKRTVLSYLTKPITKTLDESFRER
jgi:membrane fusion protein, adhesin transport system